MQGHVSPLEASPPFPAWPFPVGEAHVWFVNADDHLGELDALQTILSREERERASRIRRGRDRWIAGRASLRRVLAGCLRAEPRELELRLGPNDKPELVGAEDEHVPHFNLSHSGKMALIALAHGPVGVDVEQVRQAPDLADMVRHALRPGEIAALEALPTTRRPEGFIAAWTRKEAYLKARGLGIGDIQRVEVNVHPDERAALLYADDDPDAAARWTLVDLAVETGYRAALAALGTSSVVLRTLRVPVRSDG